MAGRMKWMRALVLTGAFAALSGMTAFAANMKAGIDSLTINAENPKKLNIKMHCNQDSSGTDGKIYIFEIKPYQSDLSGRKDPITSVDAAADMSAEFALDLARDVSAVLAEAPFVEGLLAATVRGGEERIRL